MFVHGDFHLKWSMVATTCISNFQIFYYYVASSTSIFCNVDVIGTACTSISIVTGSILADTTTFVTRIAGLAIYPAVCGSQLLRELLYLGPMLAAVGVGAWFIWKINSMENGGKNGKAAREAVQKWSIVQAVGVVAVVGGVACDKWICVLFGPHFSMLFRFFIGCNVAIFAFFPMVVLLHKSNVEAKHS